MSSSFPLDFIVEKGEEGSYMQECWEAQRQTYQHHCMWLVRDWENWRQLHTLPCGSLRVLFRGFYLGEARIPDFIPEKNFRMSQSEAKLDSIIDINADVREGAMFLGKGLYVHTKTCP